MAVLYMAVPAVAEVIPTVPLTDWTGPTVRLAAEVEAVSATITLPVLSTFSWALTATLIANRLIIEKIFFIISSVD